MPSVQIKDVPEETHAVLRRRAAAAHQSLQEYLRSRLIEEATAPTLDEILDRAGGRAGGSARSVIRSRRWCTTVLVVDASVLADDGRDGDAARDRLRGHALAAPELVDLEVASVFRQLLNKGHLDARRAELAVADLEDLPLRRARHQPLLARCWELRHNLTAYDAAYVAPAELLDTVLLTADGRLAKAPQVRCQLEFLH